MRRLYRFYPGFCCCLLFVLLLISVQSSAYAAAEEGDGSLTRALEQFDQTKNSGTIYRHPTGISFWYPSGWQIQMLSGIIQLCPDGGKNAPEQYESYFLTAENVAQLGITDPNHPQVLLYLDEQMALLGQQLGVMFQRQGLTQAPTRQGNGIRVDWTAQSNYGPVKARTYVSILDGYGLVFAAVGVKDRLAQRDSLIQQIFSSFSVGQGSLDYQLVGTWTLASSQSLQNDSTWVSSYDQAKFASETTSTLTFGQDGTWQRINKTEALMGSGSIWFEKNDIKTYRGRWNAAQGQLFMIWEDQSFADYTYSLQQKRLMIQNGKIRQTWSRQ